MKRLRVNRLAMLMALLAPLNALPSATAADLATVALGAQFIGNAIRQFDAGADPDRALGRHTYIAVRELHRRLNGYDTAFQQVLNKLDDMPEWFRLELKHISDAESKQTAMATVTLILEDVGILKAKGKPIASASIRHHDAQKASRVLMLRRAYLYLPYVIAAMNAERAFILVHSKEGGRTPELDWQERQKTYIGWFETALDASLPRSLASLYLKSKARLEERVKKDINGPWDTEGRCNMPCAPRSVVARCHGNEAWRRAEGLKKVLPEVVLMEQVWILYGRLAWHAALLADKDSNWQHVPRLADTAYTNQYSAKIAELAEKWEQSKGVDDLESEKETYERRLRYERKHGVRLSPCTDSLDSLGR